MKSVFLAVREAAVTVLAAVTGVSLMLEMLHGRSAGWDWVDLRSWPHTVSAGVKGAFVIAVLSKGLLGPSARQIARAFSGLLGSLCIVDGIRYYVLLHEGALDSRFPLPTSLLFALLLIGFAWDPRSVTTTRLTVFELSRRVVLVGSVGVAGVLVCLLLFGTSDYRRPADAIIVFGARVNPDGTASLSLADRTETACRLYHEGYAKILVLSGGHGPDAPLSEPSVMRTLALRWGVPNDAILLDETGVNTLATVRKARQLARTHRWRNVLMVSHDYHLARIKLFADRNGLSAVTVPARETRPLTRWPWFVARESAALLYWYGHRATFG